MLIRTEAGLNSIYLPNSTFIKEADSMVEKRLQMSRDTKPAFPFRSNCLKCNWQGSSEDTPQCPLCGYNTYRTPTLRTGCTTVFKFKNNLIIKDRLYQQGIVRIEEADCADLADYITTVILENKQFKPVNLKEHIQKNDEYIKKWKKGVLELGNVYKKTADN